MKNVTIAATLVSLGMGSLASADVMINQPSSDTSGERRVGQSFTTPNDGVADWIDSFSVGSNSINANGRLFLLSQEYLGTPANLGTSTPGYLSQSNPVTVAADGFTFRADFAFTGGNRVTLQPNTQYWVYSDAATDWNVRWSNANPYAGGTLYLATEGALNYTPNNGVSDAVFTLTGTPVPEPTGAMVLGGLSAAMLLRRRAERA